MIIKNKIIALILGVSLASSATYGSYAYFTGENTINNTIKIVELDSKDSAFEVSKISIRENSLILEFSKRIFYTGENLVNDVVGSENFLDDVEISIEGKELIISKKEGAFVLPVGLENKLPSITLNTNFEDRFEKDLEEVTLYLYYDSNGDINLSLTNDYKEDMVVQPDNEILVETPVENETNNGSESIENPQNEEENNLNIENKVQENNTVEEEKIDKSDKENVEGSNISEKPNNVNEEK
ncbi:hypothetical protein GNF80_09095 [Clostridium perfringens]|nr:hypothetical protein [Clostridium perfringens]